MTVCAPRNIKKLLLDISAHRCSKIFLRELRYVFPEEGDLSDIIAIPTMQWARADLVNVGDEIEAEKDRLLERVRYPFACLMLSYLSFSGL
jgi:hypothetical protein